VQFIRFDLGAVLRKESRHAGCSHRHRQSASDEGNGEVPSCAPVSVLVDEGFDGVHLSYDTMASLLAPYGNAKALEVARELNSEVEKLLTDAAH